jgi:hypothetical protein
VIQRYGGEEIVESYYEKSTIDECFRGGKGD